MQVPDANTPAPLVIQVTDPVGEIPVTVAVHRVDEAAVTGEGLQPTAVPVATGLTVNGVFPELAALSASPTYDAVKVTPPARVPVIPSLQVPADERVHVPENETDPVPPDWERVTVSPVTEPE